VTRLAGVVVLAVVLGGCALSRRPPAPWRVSSGPIETGNVAWPPLRGLDDAAVEVDGLERLKAQLSGLTLTLTTDPETASWVRTGDLGLVLSTGAIPAREHFWFGFREGLVTFPASELTGSAREIELTASYFSGWYVQRPEGAARGVAFVFSGLDHGARDAPIRSALVERGWIVVRMESKSGLFQISSAMNGSVESHAALGRAYAWVADRQLASAAVGAEAVLRVLEAEDEAVGGLPVTVIGLSAGSLAAPATALRLASRVESMVLIGAGADFLTIAHESPVTRREWGARNANGKKLSSEEVEIASRSYLASSALDPYVVGPRLSAMPVLMLQASGDTLMPSAQGEILWARLGRPEMWSFPGGHIGLFLSLGRYARSIAEWIEGVNENAAPSGAAS